MPEEREREFTLAFQRNDEIPGEGGKCVVMLEAGEALFVIRQVIDRYERGDFIYIHVRAVRSFVPVATSASEVRGWTGD